MTQTVLGFFDTAEAARAAAAQVEAAGIPAGSIDIATREGVRDASAFSRFFHHLFHDASEADLYTHAASTSGAVVTVHTDAEELGLEVANLLNHAGARSVDDPNTTYETSSSLTAYQAPEDDAIKNEYDPHTYSAAPEYGTQTPPDAAKSRGQILHEQERKARVLHQRINEELRLHDD